MKLAVFLPNWVGDACMATPTLRALKRDLSPDELCIVGRPAPLMVLEGLPWHDSTLVYKPRSKQSAVLSRRGLAGELRRRKFDCVLLLTNSFSTAAIAWLSRAKRRIGYGRNARSWMLTDAVPVVDGDFDAKSRPCIDVYLRLAAQLGCREDDRHTELACTENDRALRTQLWEHLKFSSQLRTIVLNTGAATAPTKRWPTQHAAAAAKQLVSRYSDLQILVHCGPGERDVANEIEEAAAEPRVRSMGRFQDLPLGLSKAVIEHSHLVISTDSGPRHMAVAFNRPIVSIFGSIDASLTVTYNRPEHIVSLGLDCQPCGQHHCPLGHTRCMKELPISLVVDTACRILERSLRIAA